MTYDGTSTLGPGMREDDPEPEPAMHIACTTAGASLTGAGWIGRATPWGLGTGRFSACSINSLVAV